MAFLDNTGAEQLVREIKELADETYLPIIRESVGTVSADLATHPRPNLLENWYFVGGGSQLGYGVFPLNSKGQTVYSGYNNPFIDRWGCGIGATVASGYVTMMHGDWVTQDFDGSLTAYDGETLTASILLANGTLLSGSAVPTSGAASYVDDSNIKLYSGEVSGKFEFVIRIVNTDINVVAVKLEIGSTQTLAHQESGVWVLNEVPSYGEEYAETVVSRKRLDWELLWTNPDPSIDFAAQTISLDLSDYIEFVIKFYQWKADGVITNQSHILGYEKYFSNIATPILTNGQVYLASRLIITKSTGVEFLNAGSKTSLNGNATQDNGWLIPVEIWAR